MLKSVCVYCGSSAGSSPVYTEAARSLGHELARQQITLVYGGGHVGLMGVVADSVLEQGGRVIGYIPQSLMDREVGHEGLSELHVVADMHERKAGMADSSEAFIALPGGLGTMEELFEALTWLQLGMHRKPCAVLNIDNYYDALLQFLDHSVHQGFLKQLHRDMLLVGETPEALLQEMAAFEPPLTKKWIGFGE